MTHTLNEKGTMSTTGPTASLSLATCFLTVDDPEAALGFYRDVLGFGVTTDVSHGGFRWVTLVTPHQPELGIVLHQPGSAPMTESDASAMGDLMAKGLLGALIFGCDDVDALFEHIVASGADVLQEPADQFYGVRDCAFRDPAGNTVRFNTPLQRD